MSNGIITYADLIWEDDKSASAVADGGYKIEVYENMENHYKEVTIRYPSGWKVIKISAMIENKEGIRVVNPSGNQTYSRWKYGYAETLAEYGSTSCVSLIKWSKRIAPEFF